MKTVLCLVLTCLWSPAISVAQQMTGDDPVGFAFFPPDLIMQHQEAIHLSDIQRNSIQKEMQAAQSEFMAMQWDLQKEVEKFRSLIERETVGETQTLSQLDQMLSVENKIKRRQIALLIRIKNVLDRDQQTLLQQIKSKKQ